MKPPLDPQKVICVCKHEGLEVGRIPTSAPNAEAVISKLATRYGSLQVDCVKDEDADDAWVNSALRFPRT